jgi:hypothetical protein
MLQGVSPQQTSENSIGGGVSQVGGWNPTQGCLDPIKN